MPTTNPVPSTDPSDLLFNAGKLDEVVNGTANSFTDRLGIARRTVAGMNADFDAQLADAESDLNVYRADAAASAAEALGYLQTIRTTSYGAYASDPATDPLGNPPTVGDEYFNTTANLLKRWNGTTWQASDINTANLAAPSGSSLVGYQPAGTGAVATTVQSKLRETVSVFDFMTAAEINAVKTNNYTGSVTSVGAAIQKAIDNVFSGTGVNTIFFPTGTYKVTSPLIPRSKMILLGEAVSGPDAYDPAITGTIIVTGDNALFNHTGISTGRCRVENMVINASACDSQPLVSLTLTYTWQFVNVVVQGFNSTGGHPCCDINKCWDILFDRPISYNGGTFLDIEDSAVTVKDCDIGTHSNAIYTRGGTASQPDGNPNTKVTVIGGYSELCGVFLNTNHGSLGSATIVGGYHQCINTQAGVRIAAPNVTVVGTQFPSTSAYGVYADVVADDVARCAGSTVTGIRKQNITDPYNALIKTEILTGAQLRNSFVKTGTLASGVDTNIFTIRSLTEQCVGGKIRLFVYLDKVSGAQIYKEINFIYSQQFTSGGATFTELASLSHGLQSGAFAFTWAATPDYTNRRVNFTGICTLTSFYAGIGPANYRLEVEYFGAGSTGFQ